MKWFRYWDLAASVKTQADFSASAAVALHKDSGELQETFDDEACEPKQEAEAEQNRAIASNESESDESNER